MAYDVTGREVKTRGLGTSWREILKRRGRAWRWKIDLSVGLRDKGQGGEKISTIGLCAKNLTPPPSLPLLYTPDTQATFQWEENNFSERLQDGVTMVTKCLFHSGLRRCRLRIYISVAKATSCSKKRQKLPENWAKAAQKPSYFVISTNHNVQFKHCTNIRL